MENCYLIYLIYRSMRALPACFGKLPAAWYQKCLLENWHHTWKKQETDKKPGFPLKRIFLPLTLIVKIFLRAVTVQQVKFQSVCVLQQGFVVCRG